MPVSIPVPMFPGATNSGGALVMLTDALGGAAIPPAYGAFRYADGNLYAIVQMNGTRALPNRIHILRSVDDGATWAIVDAANAPTLGPNFQPLMASAIYDLGHTVTVCYNLTTISGPTAISTALKFQDFDLATGAWGAIYGTVGAPLVFQINQIVKRTNGELVVFHNRTLLGSSVEGLEFSVFDGASWTFIHKAADGNFPGSFSNAACSVVLDPASGIIHLFTQTKTNNGSLTGVLYRQIQTDNNLGNFFVFTNQFGNLGTGSGCILTMENPVIVGDRIVFGVLDPTGSVPSVLVGTPLSNPVWSVLPAPGVDPLLGLSGGDLSTEAVFLALDSTRGILFGVYSYVDATNTTHIRLVQTPASGDLLSGWTGSELYTDSPPVFQSVEYSGLTFGVDGELLIVTNGRISSGPGQPTAWFLRSSAPPPPPVVQTVSTPGAVGGIPFGLGGHCRLRNVWDECLDRELERLRCIKFPRLCSIPEEYCNLSPWEHRRMIPPQGVPFRAAKGVTTPAPGDGDTQVVNMTVPTGYDGLVTGLYWFYSGQGFDTGSGDIIWRVQASTRWVKDLSNVPFTLGSPQTPFPLTEGLIVFSGQRVRVVVNVPNLSGMIQVGQSTISAALIGFYWPR